MVYSHFIVIYYRLFAHMSYHAVT